MSESFGLDAPLAKEQHFGLDAPLAAPPTALGDTPDVFSEGAAQAAAPPSPGLGNEITRGLLTGRRGLALANAGLYELASPVLSEATKARLQAPSFALADRLKAQQDAIPVSDIGSQMIGGLVSGPVAMLGAPGAAGQDVVARGGTPAQAQNVANIALATELPALALPGLGSSIPTRVAAQGAAGGVLSELGRTGENAVLPADQQREFSLPELAAAIGGAGAFGLIPHAPGARPQTPAELAALREVAPAVDPTAINVNPSAYEPPPRQALPPTPAPDIAEPAEAAPIPTPAEIARAAEPAAVAAIPAVPDADATAAGGGTAPTGEFSAKLDTHAADIADANPEVAHTVSQLAARAKNAGLTAEDITPFHGETDADYIDRVSAELTDYEAKHAAPPDNGPDTAGHPPDLRGETDPGAAAQAAADATAAEGQAAGVAAGRQAEPAAAADTQVVEPPVTTQEARAPEPAPAVVQATKAATDAAREARRAETIPASAPHEWHAADAQAKERIAADPTYAPNLAAEVLKSKRPVDDVESMALLNDRVRLQQQHDAASDAVAKAIDSGDKAGELRARVQLDQVETALDTNERAARYSKSEVARSLNATKAGMTHDYSLARTITRAKIAYGDAWGPKARAEIERLTAELKAAQDAAAKPKAARDTVQRTPDEKMQARVKAQIEKLEGQIKQRLSACPI